LLRESLNQPLMIIFEDLHWIDAESEAMLNMLADAIATARILRLVNYRPEYRHEWINKAHYSQVRLEPLGRQSARADGIRRHRRPAGSCSRVPCRSLGPGSGSLLERKTAQFFSAISRWSTARARDISSSFASCCHIELACSNKSCWPARNFWARSRGSIASLIRGRNHNPKT